MKRKKFLTIPSAFGLFLILNGTAFAADDTAKAFKHIFDTASKASGSVIQIVVDALWYGMLTIYRGISGRVGMMVALTVILLMIFNSVRTIMVNLGRIDILSILKRLLPDLFKNGLIFLVLTVKFPYNSGLSSSGSDSVTGTPFTFIVEKLFEAFYKLGLIFFGDAKFSKLTPGQMSEAFFGSPLSMLQNAFTSWTLLAVFANIVKILILIVCLWLAGKIVATLIGNFFTGLMLCTFSIFYLMFMVFEPLRGLAQRGINTIVSQVVTVFMTVGMVGLCYQTVKLISVSDSISGVLSMAVVMLMLQQTTENIGSMAMSITNGSGLGNSNSSAFSNLASSFAAIVGGGAIMASESVDNFSHNFKYGMENAKEGSSFGEKFLEGIKTGASNTGAGKIIGSFSDNLATRTSAREMYRQQIASGVSKEQARQNVKVYERAMKNYKLAQRELDQARMRREGLGSNMTAGIAANFFLQAMTGNLSDTKTLSSIAEKLKGSQEHDKKVKIAEEHLNEARRNVDILEQAFGDGNQMIRQQIENGNIPVSALNNPEEMARYVEMLQNRDNIAFNFNQQAGYDTYGNPVAEKYYNSDILTNTNGYSNFNINADTVATNPYLNIDSSGNVNTRPTQAQINKAIEDTVKMGHNFDTNGTQSFGMGMFTSGLKGLGDQLQLGTISYSNSSVSMNPSDYYQRMTGTGAVTSEGVYVKTQKNAYDEYIRKTEEKISNTERAQNKHKDDETLENNYINRNKE